jgi:DNA (cytosine-5)-methyltransferase 1
MEQAARYTAIDLFCGAGGLTAGLIQAGFDVVGAVDSWDAAARVYKLNFPHPICCEDVCSLSGKNLLEEFELNGREPDLVVGGPPCQGFSVQRVGPDTDSRNSLVLEFARLVSELQPMMFLMENVTGLLGRRGRPYGSALEAKLRHAGYVVKYAIVDAVDYRVPQFRKRVFYYGWRLKDVVDFDFPRPCLNVDAYRTVWDVIGDLSSPPADHTPAPGDPLHRRIRLSPTNVGRLSLIPQGGGMEDLPEELRVNCHKIGAEKIGHRFVYGRLDARKPSATITAKFDSFTRGKFAHPFEDRNITLREGARIQTFDDTFVFSGTQEQIAAMIGNAIPPMLAKDIGSAMRSHILAVREGRSKGGRPHAVGYQLPLLEPALET